MRRLLALFSIPALLFLAACEARETRQPPAERAPASTEQPATPAAPDQTGDQQAEPGQRPEQGR